jgi:hypothetical protein
MAYTMTDEVTGNEFEFDDKFPTSKARDIIMSKRPANGSKPSLASANGTPTPTPPPMIEGSSDVSGADLPTAKDVVGGVVPFIRPGVEGGAAALGGAAGARRHGTRGALAGAGTAYTAAKGVLDAAEEGVGLKPSPSVVGNVLRKGEDFLIGAGMEAGGQAGGKIIEKGLPIVGRFGKALMGKLTGTGTAAVEEAVASGKAAGPLMDTKTGFDRAMRGEVSGEQIVDSAQAALNTVKDQRRVAYQAGLKQLEGKRAIDISPIRRKMDELLQNYGFKYVTDPTTGEVFLDSSRTALNEAGNRDVLKIVEKVKDWGKQKGDRTPLGLDILKRQLDDFYSESKATRQMVASLRSEVSGVIKRDVPEYATMTKGYAEATELVKDFEAGLMLRKQGMSGRVTADKTLRRLTSAMKDNNELRLDLLKVLGSQGGVDELTGQVAGHSMGSIFPRGLAGETPFLIGEVAMAYKLLNPQWWPVLALSSPRVAGEFLRVIGKVSAKTAGTSGGVGKTLGYGATYGASKLFNPRDTVPPAQETP